MLGACRKLRKGSVRHAEITRELTFGASLSLTRPGISDPPRCHSNLRVLQLITSGFVAFDISVRPGTQTSAVKMFFLYIIVLILNLPQPIRNGSMSRRQEDGNLRQ
jgi:hypothetical protein